MIIVVYKNDVVVIIFLFFILWREDSPSVERESIHQVGRGDPPSPSGPTGFEIVRPPEVNHFVLEVV